MDLQLDGKTALVSGSSKGIGEAIAMALARERATVVVHGRDRVRTETVANAIIARGGRAFAVVGDLTSDEDVERIVENAESLAGSIDILVNNAGGSGGSTENWTEIQPSSWAAAYDRNVLAALRITRRLLPSMQLAKWGRVINISSIAAMMPPPSSPDYSACKAAMNAMTVSMSKAVASHGVTVNAVLRARSTASRAISVSGALQPSAAWPVTMRHGMTSSVPSYRCLQTCPSAAPDGRKKSRMPLPFSPVRSRDILRASTSGSTADFCLVSSETDPIEQERRAGSLIRSGGV